MTIVDSRIQDEGMKWFCERFTFETICLHSAWIPQIDIAKKYFKKQVCLTERNWNIYNENNNKYDVLFLSNVLMYISNPKKVIQNLLKSCKYLMIQEPIIRYRGLNEIGGDGDVMRYSYKEHKAKLKNAFDLDSMNLRVLYEKVYMDGDSKHLFLIVKS